MDKEIEELVKSCENCRQIQPSPPRALLQPWSWPSKPWARIHLDYAGPVENKMFLVVVDAHTKWMEVCYVASSASAATITHLHRLFAQFGIPKNVVMDNGSCFTSLEFSDFLKSNGVNHLLTPPYHPQSNELAERYVRIFKNGLKTIQGNCLDERLAKLLFSYHTTPQTTIGLTPGELVFGRLLKKRFDFMFSNVQDRVEERQVKQRSNLTIK